MLKFGSQINIYRYLKSLADQELSDLGQSKFWNIQNKVLQLYR